MDVFCPLGARFRTLHPADAPTDAGDTVMSEYFFRLYKSCYTKEAVNACNEAFEKKNDRDLMRGSHSDFSRCICNELIMASCSSSTTLKMLTHLKSSMQYPLCPSLQTLRYARPCKRCTKTPPKRDSHVQRLSCGQPLDVENRPRSQAIRQSIVQKMRSSFKQISSLA